MINEIQDWKYEDCLAFMLINAAAANFNFEPEELDIIKNSVKPEAYRKAHSLFQSSSDYQNAQLILELQKTFFRTPAEKETLLKDIKRILLADNKFETTEQNFLREVQRLIGRN